jgi:hypothetical protein
MGLKFKVYQSNHCYLLLLGYHSRNNVCFLIYGRNLNNAARLWPLYLLDVQVPPLLVPQTLFQTSDLSFGTFIVIFINFVFLYFRDYLHGLLTDIRRTIVA